jgi:hypothetical protein
MAEDKESYTPEESARFAERYARIMNHSNGLYGNPNSRVLKSAIELTERAISDYQSTVPANVRKSIGTRHLDSILAALEERKKNNS